MTLGHGSSQPCEPEHEERTPMERTKQDDVRVMDRVGTGRLSRVMADGF